MIARLARAAVALLGIGLLAIGAVGLWQVGEPAVETLLACFAIAAGALVLVGLGCEGPPNVADDAEIDAPLRPLARKASDDTEPPR